MNSISLLKSPYYPYHLTWEELNNPGVVLQNFLNKWDLQHCRVLLKRWQALVELNKFEEQEPGYAEIRHFINDLEKLIEAVFILRLQFDEINEMKV